MCFPEMSVTSYVDPLKQSDAVLNWGDPQFAPLFRSSKHNHMTLIAGIIELNAYNKPLISQGVIRGGQLLGVDRKTNLGEGEEGFSAGI